MQRRGVCCAPRDSRAIRSASSGLECCVCTNVRGALRSDWQNRATDGGLKTRVVWPLEIFPSRYALSCAKYFYSLHRVEMTKPRHSSPCAWLPNRVTIPMVRGDKPDANVFGNLNAVPPVAGLDSHLGCASSNHAVIAKRTENQRTMGVPKPLDGSQVHMVVVVV